MKKAEKVQHQAANTDTTRGQCKLFRRNCGSACSVLCVLLLGLLFGALLVRTNGGLSFGGFQHAAVPNALVCWSLVVAGIAGTGLAGHGISWGWLILFGLQPLWIAYGIVTEQHAFILAALACGIAQANGFVRSCASSASEPSESMRVAPACRLTK